MTECSVEFDEATQSGALVVRVRFERALPKAAYDDRLRFALSLGAIEDEARAYAGHLDFQKPAAAIAEMKQAAPSIAVDWDAMLSEAVRGARA